MKPFVNGYYSMDKNNSKESVDKDKGQTLGDRCTYKSEKSNLNRISAKWTYTKYILA